MVWRFKETAEIHIKEGITGLEKVEYLLRCLRGPLGVSDQEFNVRFHHGCLIFFSYI